MMDTIQKIKNILELNHNDYKNSEGRYYVKNYEQIIKDILILLYAPNEIENLNKYFNKSVNMKICYDNRQFTSYYKSYHDHFMKLPEHIIIYSNLSESWKNPFDLLIKFLYTGDIALLTQSFDIFICCCVIASQIKLINNKNLHEIINKIKNDDDYEIDIGNFNKIIDNFSNCSLDDENILFVLLDKIKLNIDWKSNLIYLEYIKEANKEYILVYILKKMNTGYDTINYINFINNNISSDKDYLIELFLKNSKTNNYNIIDILYNCNKEYILYENSYLCDEEFVINNKLYKLHSKTIYSKSEFFKNHNKYKNNESISSSNIIEISDHLNINVCDMYIDMSFKYLYGIDIKIDNEKDMWFFILCVKFLDVVINKSIITQICLLFDKLAMKDSLPWLYNDININSFYRLLYDITKNIIKEHDLALYELLLDIEEFKNYDIYD